MRDTAMRVHLVKKRFAQIRARREKRKLFALIWVYILLILAWSKSVR